MNKKFAELLEKFKKKGTVTLHVTTIARSSVCPFQSFFYSRNSPHRPRSSNSFIVGSLSHLCFELIYDKKYQVQLDNLKKNKLDKKQTHKFKIDLIQHAMDELKTQEYNKYELLMQNKNEVLAQVLKYLNAFFNYAKYAPVPYACELYVQRGIIAGVIDRLDYDGRTNEFIITDYKTSRSKLNEDLLQQYFLQLGGYAYILQNTKIINKPRRSLDYFSPTALFDTPRLGAPRLVVIKQKSFQTIICKDFKYYMKDFEYLLTDFVQKLLRARYIDDLEREPGPHCHYCLVRDVCEKYKEYK